MVLIVPSFSANDMTPVHKLLWKSTSAPVFIEYLVQELGPLDIEDCVTVAYALNSLLPTLLSLSLKDILSSADK
jgi:hypothetical protein